MEEATKKFSLDLSESVKNAKEESEKQLGAERERMSTVSIFFQKARSGAYFIFYSKKLLFPFIICSVAG